MECWLVKANRTVEILLDVADLKLCEVYWLKLKEQVNENRDFLDLLLRLNLQEIMIKQTKLFLPSRSLQISVSFIVMHVLMAEPHLGPKT